MIHSKILWILLALLVVTNVFVYRSMFALSSIVVEKLSAGEGSAVLIRAPGGRAVLVGAGPDASILRALGEALPPWRRQLDALVLLGPSIGQAGGAPLVLERYRVAHLLRPETRGAPTREAAITAAAGDTPITEIPLGRRIVLHYGSQLLDLSALLSTTEL